ncbi:MAG: GDSL-type esterase/lipase family protein [Bacteroidetes bacterium]|nr:GDSL-type esterase/lipase family protein [Bacteroidota bacterium]
MRKSNFLTCLVIFTAINIFAQNNFYPANHSSIQYEGRLDKSNSAQYYFSWSGVSISTKFKGTEIKAVIKDFATGGATKTNYFNVLVDGVRVNKLEVKKSDTLYLLASKLSNTEHTIEITKRTEASVGKCSFKGFFTDGTLLSPDPLPSVKMEIVGDSRSCGYGNEKSYVNPNDTPGFHSVNEDNYYAWGAMASRNLGVQYHCTAYSGKGMYRNNNASTSGVLPDIYDRIHPDESNSAWNHAEYVPDIIVILLGTNDFASENAWGTTHDKMLDSSAYVGKYIAFIQKLRDAYGSSTKIVCAFGNSLSVYTPLNQLNRWRNYITSIVDYRDALGDKNVYPFEFKANVGPYGEDWHPTIAGQKAMSDQITPFLQGLLSQLSVAQEIYDQVNFTVFPNPANDVLQLLSSTNILNSSLEYTIYNNLGSVVLVGQGSTINIEKLSSGIYFVKTGDKVFKFIKSENIMQ